jgi:hypothetical protein
LHGIFVFATSGLSLFQWNTLKSSANPNEDTMQMLLIIGITCGILGTLFLISICCLFKSLKLAIDVIDASADFLAKTKRVIIIPVIKHFINLIAVLVWISAYITVTSIKFITPNLDYNPAGVYIP